MFILFGKIETSPNKWLMVVLQWAWHTTSKKEDLFRDRERIVPKVRKFSPSPVTYHQKNLGYNIALSHQCERPSPLFSSQIPVFTLFIQLLYENQLRRYPMNLALLAVMFLFYAGEIAANPWSDDFVYASINEDQKETCLLTDIPNIRRRLTYTEEHKILREEGMKGFRDPSKMLLFFSGIAGIVVAGRHIRKR